tara:strand:- start:1051 stop:1305 length:255 start_codon:yes stop_codon:yes gene_type:complete
MTEPVVTIKFTQSEVKKLIEALKVVKDVKLPPLPNWKKPYVQLLKDLQKINKDIDEAKKSRDEAVASESFREESVNPKCEVCDD